MGIESSALACQDAFRPPGRFDPHVAFDIFHSVTRDYGYPIVPTSFLATDGLLPSLGMAVAGRERAESTTRLLDVQSEMLRRMLPLLPAFPSTPVPSRTVREPIGGAD